MHLYEVEFEIAGPAAMFARPDTGAAPISYPVPTWSACKAMFESVARGVFHMKRETDERVQPAAFFCPTEVEVLRPIRLEKYVINYRGPLRKSNQISGSASYQLPATILIDVCYRVKALCMRIPDAPDPGGNAPHALQEMFKRRLAQGKSKYAPSLGWKEFLPSYFGPYRPHDEDNPEAPCLQDDLDLGLPAFLLSVWDRPSNGGYAPIFREVILKGGRLAFPIPHLDSGKLIFPEKQDAN